MTTAAARRSAAFTLLLASTVSACSDPKAVSEENFRRAIDPLVADKFCAPIRALQAQLTERYEKDRAAFPIVVPATAFRFSGTDDRDARAFLEGALAQGMLARKERTAPAKAESSGEPLKPMPLLLYTPTEKGKSMFRAVQNRRTGTSSPQTCLGTGKVDDVVRWTEPGDMFGARITQVTYTYKATDIPSDVPAEVREGLDVPKEGKATLMLASDGWQEAGR